VARTTHGLETRKARTKRSLATAKLAALEEIGFAIGLMSGRRTRGRRPGLLEKAYLEIPIRLKCELKTP